MKKVFITGISGYIGGTIAVKLMEKGYEVSGLVRNKEKQQILEEKGFRAILSDLDHRELYAPEIERADIIIHTAEADDYSIARYFTDVLAGTNKTFIYTSGSNILVDPLYPSGNDVYFNEDIPLDTDAYNGHRIYINRMIQRAALQGVRSIVIVPTMVYGEGLLINKESKQIPLLVRTAVKKGYASYINDGMQAWSNVHVEDLADLYLLAIDHADPGSIFYAASGLLSFKEIAVTIAETLRLSSAVKSWTMEEAIQEWGEMMSRTAYASNCRVSSRKAERLLNWQPSRPALLEYLKNF